MYTKAFTILHFTRHQRLQLFGFKWECENSDFFVSLSFFRRLYIAPVTGTNLRLVVESRSNSWCPCDGDTRLTTKPRDCIFQNCFSQIFTPGFRDVCNLIPESSVEAPRKINPSRELCQTVSTV